MPLNHTAVAVLGLVAAGHRNGWEISRVTERSTRHFWSVSKGGIYPELRRLREAGLLAATDDHRGEVARHSYTITEAGRAALTDWLAADEPGFFEMRNEDLLRLFLAEQAPPAQQRDLVRRVRAVHERKLTDLTALRDQLGEAPVPPPPRLLVLDYGIALNEAAVAWCRETEQRLG